MAITPEPEVQFYKSLASATAGRETDVVGDPAHQASDLAAEATRPHGRRRKRSISPEVMRGLAQIADVGAIVVSGLAAAQIYLVELGRDPRADYGRYWLAIVLAALIFPFAHRKLGGYVAERLDQLVWQVGRLALAWAGTLSLLATLAFLAKVATFYSRGWATLFVTLAFGALASNRIGTSLLIQRWARAGRLSRVVAVIGAGPLGQQIVAKLKAAKESRVTLAGIFDDRMTRVPSEIEGFPVLGTTDDLVAQVRQSLIDEVILALPLSAEARIGSLVEKLRSLPVDLRLSFDPIASGFPVRGVSQTASIQLIDILDRPLKHWNAVVKWIEDKILGAIGIVLCAPVMALIALVIRLDSEGPVFFMQERFGFNNNRIRVFKFRTMSVEQSDPTGAERTTPDDPRVTRVGWILRRFSLDELPQLFNVFVGDMSLVGPRPHVIAMRAGDRLYHEAVGQYFQRHRVRPGITGWAQVHGLRGEIDNPEKARKRVDYDLWYIDHWSPWLDVKILLLTLRVILSGKNAY